MPVLSDTIELRSVSEKLDENLDYVESSSWLTLGKCAILKNTSGKTIKAHDGQSYIYSYEIYMRLKKGMPFPVKGDTIRITKKDLSINREECLVEDSVTLKQYLRIWV